MHISKRTSLISFFTCAITALALQGCASKPVTHVPGYDVIYYDNSVSKAQNILKLVYFNRYVSDGRFSTRDWQKRKDDTENHNHFAKQANTRSSQLYKQLRNAVNVDATRPFDQPNLISWVEVDSLRDYGTESYKKAVYKATSKYLLDSLDASIESNFDPETKAASVEFSSDACESIQSQLHPKKIRRGEWIGSGEDVTCFINFNHEIIRPLLAEDWKPSDIQLDDGKQYVIVRTRVANFEAYLYGKQLTNSYMFFPHKRTTHKRGRSISAGKGTPFLLHQEQVFLFARPYNQQEAIIPSKFWVYGNKLP